MSDLEKTPQIVSSETFESEVMQSRIPVLVDFSAKWCPPCNKMLPVLDELCDCANGVYKVVKVDIEDSQDLAIRFSVDKIPAFLVVKDGQPGQKVIGMQTKTQLLQLIG